MPEFDDASDKMVNAFRTLLGTNVPSYLALEIGTDPTPVRSTYPFDIPIDQVGSIELPAIFVHRFRTQRAQHTFKNDRRLTTFRVTYVLDPVPRNAQTERVQMLSRVFEACMKAVLADTLVTDSSTPLQTAGAVWLNPNEVVVRYGFISDEGSLNVFPMMQADFPVLHDPDIPAPATIVSEGPPVELHGDLDVHQSGTDSNPLTDVVEFTATAPAEE